MRTYIIPSLIVSTLLVSLIIPLAPVEAATLFQTDFESDTTGIADAINNLSQQGPTDASVVVTTERAHTGSKSVKFNLNYEDWDNSYTLNKRAEVLPSGTQTWRYMTLGKEYWFGFSEYMPATWVNDLAGNGETLWQFHGSATGPGKASPPLALYVNTDNMRISVRGATTTVYADGTSPPEQRLVYMPLAPDKGRWVDWVIKVVFNYSGGVVKVWKDGTLVLNYKGSTIYRTSSQTTETGPYPKFGVYKWAWGTNPTQVTNRTLYLDDLKHGDADSTCATVKPPSSPLCHSAVTPVTMVSTNASTTTAKPGDTVTVTFVSNDTSQVVPTGTIAGRAARVLANGTGIGTSTAMKWTGSVTMLASDSVGAVPFSFHVGNAEGVGTTTVSVLTAGSPVSFSGGTFSLPPPVVVLVGSSAETLIQNSTPTYSDPGAVAVDAYGRSLPVSRSGDVTTSIVGSYLLTYTATDEWGKSGSATRTVSVVSSSSSTTTTPTKKNNKGKGSSGKRSSIGDIGYDLALGASGTDVLALQEFLLDDGHTIPAGATGYFGTQTQAALAAYQQSRGITPAAGYFGPLTRVVVAATEGSDLASAAAPDNTAATVLTRDLVEGDTGDEVRWLQSLLNTHGFAVSQTAAAGSLGNETTYFGRATLDAVKRFQATFAEEILVPLGLTAPTGRVDSATRAKLNSL
ncbi:MAG TPA: heparin lyase I family protein [Candidatus Paceibacterota bacterium]|nr:heparin lyase I family protein [Candidatus Paceibacterota bacterium]